MTRWLAAVSGAGADGAGARQVRAAAPDEARRAAAEHEEALQHRHHQQQQQDDVRNSASAAGRYDVSTRARFDTQAALIAIVTDDSDVSGEKVHWACAFSGETWMSGVSGRRMSTVPAPVLCSRCSGSMTPFNDDADDSGVMSPTSRASMRSRGSIKSRRSSLKNAGSDDKGVDDIDDDHMSVVSHQRLSC